MTTLSDARQAVADNYLANEDALIRRYRAALTGDAAEIKSVSDNAASLIEKIREHPDFNSGLDAFMAEYSLDSAEGIRLMTLAEALARIPDEETREALIRSKLTGADWARHVGKSLSAFVNSSTRALLFSSAVLESDEIPFLTRIIHRMGEPAIRMAIETGMGVFSDHFVLGETLEQAKKKISRNKRRYRYSFDMLGEAAMTSADAKRYEEEYRKAIEFAGEFERSSVSIKLSALHPRYEANQYQRVMDELYPRINDLVELARQRDVQITVDAEEADRLELSLAIIEKLKLEGAASNFDRLGLAVQAYSRRCEWVLDYLAELAKQSGHRIPVRLVKGAYWDTEIKLAQTLGLSDFPVFTRKSHTDIGFLFNARKLLSHHEWLFPQFATHNAHTVANILHWARELPGDTAFEFQRLHGMGEILYDCLIDSDDAVSCCIYAPIGHRRELLPYLIRRLLENSANSSFVNQLASQATTVELARHPAQLADSETGVTPAPDIFPDRINSRGLNPSVQQDRSQLIHNMNPWCSHQWSFGTGQTVKSPVDGSIVGEMSAQAPDIEQTFEKLANSRWATMQVEERVNLVDRYADNLQDHMPELLALLGREAGKSIVDGIAEIREAIDFCRFYGQEALKLKEQRLPGVSGEANTLNYRPRGTVVCISPWNFPAAIFTGQVVAALLAGNTVIAKPAPQTGLTAKRLVDLMYAAGIPEDALQVVTGDGETGATLVNHARVAAVLFTGSVATAQKINKSLANRSGPIVPLIAETGGQNAMIVESSALPEQVVKDVLQSAFGSAGQRCSALRVLYVQDACADRIIELLSGAMQELKLGNPLDLSVDVGPLIDEAARQRLEAHVKELDESATLIARTADVPQSGTFFAPCCYEIDSIHNLDQEHFGPILHLVRYKREALPRVLEDIESTGFGLTLGIHSRNEAFVDYICQRVTAGNVYINRNMIGAVVESQPFGGTGLSGTGPKAGGPHYLHRLVTEQSVSNNIAAIGGAIDLIGG